MGARRPACMAICLGQVRSGKRRVRHKRKISLHCRLTLLTRSTARVGRGPSPSGSLARCGDGVTLFMADNGIKVYELAVRRRSLGTPRTTPLKSSHKLSVPWSEDRGRERDALGRRRQDLSKPLNSSATISCRYVSSGHHTDSMSISPDCQAQIGQDTAPAG